MFVKILAYGFIQLLCALKGDGVSLSLTPVSMVIGSSAANPVMSLIIQCSSGGTPDIDELVFLRLSRRKFTETSFVGVASLRSSNPPARLEPTVPSDIQTKSPNVTGSVEIDKKSGTLTLSLNAQGMTCTDQAEFSCSMIYLDPGTNTQIVYDNKNFTVITVPSDVIMDSPEYYNANGNTLQLTNNSVLAVGTRIKFRCMANVGSLPEGEIIWERTSELGSQNSFITYTPTPSTDIVQEESQQKSGCFYRRTSTMYYNLTKLDDDGISFRCKAWSYLAGQPYEALANQQYRAVAVSASSGGTSKSQEAPPAQFGAIVGAVIGTIAGVAVIIVVSLLVYFLWYRRRSSGESYKTKDEGERSIQTGNLPDLTSRNVYDSDMGYESLQGCRKEASPYQTLSPEISDQKNVCNESITIRLSPGTDKVYINTAVTSTLGNNEYESLQVNKMETHPYQVVSGKT